MRKIDPVHRDGVHGAIFGKLQPTGKPYRHPIIV
jgi:hypothetical protein